MNPSQKKIRLFGTVLALVAGVNAVLAWRGESWSLWAFGALFCLGVLSAAVPRVGKPVFNGWMRAAAAVGGALSTAALALLYFGLMSPLAFYFRRTGRDGLGLTKTPGTYWRPLSPVRDKDYFRRLF